MKFATHLISWINQGRPEDIQKDKVKPWKSGNNAISRSYSACKGRSLPEEEWKGITKFDKDICYEKSCLDAALEFMTAVNFTVDPCNNDTWLDYACKRRVNGPDNIDQIGRLMRNTDKQTLDILKASTETGPLKNEFLLKEAQTYYNQCKNKAQNDKRDVKDIYEFLSETYGNWPIFTNRDPNEKFNWATMVAHLNRMERKGFTPLILQVGIPGIGSHIELDIGQTIFGAISWTTSTHFSTESTKMLGSKNLFRLDQISEMQTFQNTLNQVVNKQSDKGRGTMAELQKDTDDFFAEKKMQSNINWLKFFTQIFASTEVPISNDTVVEMPFDTVMGVLHTLAVSDQKAVANALFFQFASMLIQESTTLVDDLNTFKCTEETGIREQICLTRTKEIFGFSLGKTFLKVYLDLDKATPLVADMMKKIQTGYINVILGYKWMANSTKAFLEDKIQSMQTYITQPDWLKEKNALEKYYSGLSATTDKGSSYPLNFMNVNSWSVIKKRNWLRKTAILPSFADFDIYDIEWSRYLGTTQATYSKSTNQIRIEGGILQSPIFGPDAPGFMNYGGLGTVISHETGHSFDTSGRRFDKNSNEGEFWDKESQLMYNKWVSEIADRYEQETHQTSETSAETVSAEQTIDEDIADVMGVHMSFLSYLEYLKELEAGGRREKVLPGLKSFAPQKLFFMKYTNMWCDNKEVQDLYTDLLQSHSVGNTRATVPLMLSNQFASTFGCKAR
ncbi:Neprilysin-1 [Orchesella cincta]|uniref:Neprilysin-1 n=1 Tax=Orchesella cincta TaxID=48709 RepID=A0A1D2MEK8_ORCCI|nr:Neprilysin-1 [Orchesella cincta]